MTTFECEQCGSCCRLAHCDHLEGNICTIYDARPKICRVDEMADHYGIDREAYFKATKVICEAIRSNKWTH